MSSCLVCGREIPRTGRRGRPRTKCGIECHRRHVNSKRRVRRAIVRRALARVRLYDKGGAPLELEPPELEPWRVEYGGLL